jgi:Secretion system C-terminal sorting domain
MFKKTILILLAIVLFAGTIYAFPKKVLFEEFTNTSCNPCASVAPYVEDFIDAHIDDLAIVITHAGFPGPDPWYVAAPEIMDFRITYYDVWGVPTGKIGGATTVISSLYLEAGFEEEHAEVSPVQMELLVTNEDEDVVNAEIRVISGDDPVSGDYKLRVALVEIHRHFNADNGQSEWHYGLLDMLPDASGTDFSIDANSTNNYSFDFDLGGYDFNNIAISAWIQNENDKSVLQAEMSEETLEYEFSITDDVVSGVVESGLDKEYDFEIKNIGLNSDTYSIEITDGLPDGWTYTYMTPDGEQTGNSTMELGSYENYIINVTVTTSEDQVGLSGNLGVTITSTNNSEITETAEFFTMSSAEILIVDQGTNGSNSVYYTSALDAIYDQVETDYSYGVWTSTEHKFNTTDLASISDIDLVIWFLGADGSTDADDIAGLEVYLSNGGSLYITGCRAPDLISNTTLIEMMGATFQSRYPDGTSVNGVDDDPISDGMSLSLEGGSGAGNLGSPSSMTLNGGSVSFKYSPLRRAAIRRETDDYRSLIMGFPFESISDEANRYELMLNSLIYLCQYDLAGIPEDDNSTLPETVSIEHNYPNPFNPDTEINFTLKTVSDVRLSVFDVTGREIALLVSGRLSAGQHSCRWSPENCSSGIYFYRITVQENGNYFEQTRKMLLIK